jgi:hypothetical protein
MGPETSTLAGRKLAGFAKITDWANPCFQDAL